MKKFLNYIYSLLPYIITVIVTILALEYIDNPYVIGKSYHIISLSMVFFSTVVFATIFKYKSLLKSCKENKFFYESILNQMPFAIFYKDLNGKYKYVNDFFTTLYKSVGNDVIGKHTKEIFNKVTSESTISDSVYSDIRLLRGEQVVVDEKVFNLENGNHSFIVVKTLHKDEHNKIKGILGVGFNSNDVKNYLGEIFENIN